MDRIEFLSAAVHGVWAARTLSVGWRAEKDAVKSAVYHLVRFWEFADSPLIDSPRFADASLVAWERYADREQVPGVVTDLVSMKLMLQAYLELRAVLGQPPEFTT